MKARAYSKLGSSVSALYLVVGWIQLYLTVELYPKTWSLYLPSRPVTCCCRRPASHEPGSVLLFHYRKVLFPITITLLCVLYNYEPPIGILLKSYRRVYPYRILQLLYNYESSTIGILLKSYFHRAASGLRVVWHHSDTGGWRTQVPDHNVQPLRKEVEGRRCPIRTLQ